jgi:hypothetical protein
MEPDRPICKECKEEFDDSYLFQNFDHPVCDSCRYRFGLAGKSDGRSGMLTAMYCKESCCSFLCSDRAKLSMKIHKNNDCYNVIFFVSISNYDTIIKSETIKKL